MSKYTIVEFFDLLLCTVAIYTDIPSMVMKESCGYTHKEMNSTSLPWGTEASPHMETLTTTMELLLTG